MTRSKNFHVSAAALVIALATTAAAAEPANLGLRPTQVEDAPAAGVLTPPDGENLDWSALNWDPSRLSTSSATIPAHKSLPNAWQTKLGVDANTAIQPRAVGAPINPDTLLPGGVPSNASDAGWAKLTGPGYDSAWDKTSFEARFDPAHEERKVGTTLSKSVPLNEQFSVTLENGYSVTQTPGVPYAGHDAMASHYGTDTAAKLNMLSTGTSLSVGTAMSTMDDKWRRSLGAEQKLFGGISVKGTVTESAIEGGVPDRSLTAGFKRSW